MVFMRNVRTVFLMAGLCGLWAAPAAAQGEAGWALRFHGNGVNDIDRVKIAIDAPPRPADVGVGDFTLEFWMYAALAENGSRPAPAAATTGSRATSSSTATSTARATGATSAISLYGGRISFGVAQDTNGNSICGATMVADNQWHHVAVTRRISDGQLRIFVDGNSDAIGTGPTGDVSLP